MWQFAHARSADPAYREAIARTIRSHTVLVAEDAGAIVGVGSTGHQKVRWGLARHIVWAWIITIPASAAVAAFGWWIGRLLL